MIELSSWSLLHVIHYWHVAELLMFCMLILYLAAWLTLLLRSHCCLVELQGFSTHEMRSANTDSSTARFLTCGLFLSPCWLLLLGLEIQPYNKSGENGLCFWILESFQFSSFSMFLSFFPCSCDKMPGPKQLEREDFVLAGNSRERSVMEGILVWWELDAITIYSEEQRSVHTCSRFTLPILHSPESPFKGWSDSQLMRPLA